MGPEPLRIDTTVAHPARMYDYLLGGGNNFAVDRRAVKRASAAVGGIDNARADARANRAFLRRAVRYLAADAGIDQFLDIGTGIPTGDDTWELVHELRPDARTVFVDNDPIVLAHAHALVRPAPEGATAYVDGDLRSPTTILRDAATTLDFRRPVAIMLVAVLDLIGDEHDPWGIVARLVDALAPGSYLAISHMTRDVQPEAMTELARYLNRASRGTFTLRDRSEVERFLDGLEIIDPGVVPIEEWRPDNSPPDRPRPWVAPLYGAIARKP